MHIKVYNILDIQTIVVTAIKSCIYSIPKCCTFVYIIILLLALYRVDCRV